MLEKYVVVKYLRLSLEDGDKPESDSITNQRNLLDFEIGRLFKNQPIEIVEIVDDGYTGTNLNRPGMKKLLILAETKQINCVIVKDFSRFARDYVEVGLYAEKKFPEWMIRFISVNDRYDSNDFRGITGGIDMVMKSIAYTMYSRDLSEKVRSAKKMQYKNGKFISRYAFYGYMKSPDDKHKLIIDPPAAEVVKRIFVLRSSGITLHKIAYRLNEEKTPTPMLYKKMVNPKCPDWSNIGGQHWGVSTVVSILRDERYTGKLIGGKYERVISLDGSKMKMTEANRWIVVENTHEAIITQELFDAVQALSKSGKNVKNVKTSPELLRGLIKCGGCRRKMSSLSHTQTKYYCPYKMAIPENDCFQDRIDEQDIVKFLFKAIRSQLDKTVDISKAQERVNELLKKNEKVIKSIQKDIDTEKKKKLAEYVRLTKAQISENEFIQRRMKIEEKIDKLSEKMQNLKHQAISQKDISVLNLFGKYISIEEFDREVIQDLVKEVYIYPDRRMKIVWNFKESSN